MWYDDPFVKLKKRKTNRKRRTGREPILMVSARSSQLRREQIQRIGAVVLCLLVLAGIAFLALAGGRMLFEKLYSNNPAFTVRNFEIKAGARLSERIFEYAGLTTDMNLFAVDLGQVRRNLLMVPNVSQVLVRRELPDRLVVEVSERVAVARIGPEHLSYPLAIDRHGVVFLRGSRAPNLPMFTGSGLGRLKPGDQVADESILDALKVLEIVENHPALARLVRIAAIDTGRPDELLLTLQDGSTAQLDRAHLKDRLVELAAMIQEMDGRGESWNHFNLTVDKNPAVS